MGFGGGPAQVASAGGGGGGVRNTPNASKCTGNGVVPERGCQGRFGGLHLYMYPLIGTPLPNSSWPPNMALGYATSVQARNGLEGHFKG